MKDQKNTPLADAFWPTSADAGRGTIITLTQEIAPVPQICCALTSLVPQGALEESLDDDDDAPCGDPDRPFSYKPEDVSRWLYRFYGSHERLETLLIIASEMAIGDWLTLLGAAGPDWTT
jgi:hypothetical protein